MSAWAFGDFWAALNAALEARGIAAARYREARDFWDFGDRDAERVARTWAPDDAQQADYDRALAEIDADAPGFIPLY